MAFNKVRLTDAVNRSCDKFGYSDPRNLLRRLGFDSKIIDEVLQEDTTMPMHPRKFGDTRRIRGARDDDPIVDAESAMSAIEEIAGQLPDAEQAELANMLEERLLADVDEPGAADRRRRRRAEDAHAGRRRSRLGRDEPEPFPGMPRVGGGQDPLDARAQDRIASRRALTGAMDSADSFDRLFPDARHIRIAG
jgi:hypothetical protein